MSRPAGRLRAGAVTAADLYLPAIAGGLLLVPLLGFDLDVGLSALFHVPGAGFPLQHDWLLETALHDRVKTLARGLVALLALAALASLGLERLRPLRRPLWYVAIAVPLAAAAVTAAKHASLQTCPAGLAMFGGLEPYFHLFQPAPPGAHSGKCWPGGHAASAFAFFPLVFAARWLGRRRLARGLFWLVMLGGLVLTLVQVARGMHFFSHQVWTALICWYVSLAACPFFLAARYPWRRLRQTKRPSSIRLAAP